MCIYLTEDSAADDSLTVAKPHSGIVRFLSSRGVADSRDYHLP